MLDMISNRSKEVLKIFDSTRCEKISEFNNPSKYSSIEVEPDQEQPDMPASSKIFVNASHLRNLSSNKNGGLPTSSSASMFGKSIFHPLTARQTIN
jgi:hypothetical protein